MKNQTTKIKLLILVLMLACIGANAQTYTQVLSLTGPGTSTWTNTTGATVTVRITARGGDGGRYPTQNGGSGATEVGEFTVANGETIRAIAGGAGASGNTGGGGGGSGAVNTSTNTLLLIAGAGGGGRSAGGGQGGFAFNGSNQGSGNGGATSFFVGGGGGINSAGNSSITNGGGQVSFSGLSLGSAGYSAGNGANGMGGGSGGCYLLSGFNTYIIGGNGGGYTGGGSGSVGGLGGTSYNTGTSQTHTGGCDNCGGNPTPVNGSVVIETKITCINPTVPTISASSTTNCGVQATSLSIASGSLNQATDWKWYSGTCGGTLVGTGTSINISPSGTTTYFVRGEGGCATPGSCASVTITVNNLQLWYLDNDNDGHYVSGPASSCTSPGPGWSSTASFSGDCNDLNPAVYQTLNGYVDQDGDGYTVGSLTSVCSGASLPTGYTANSLGTDCSDINPNIHAIPTITCPGNQTAFASGACTAVVNYTVTPSAFSTLNYVVTGATTASGSGSGSGIQFVKGTSTVTITASNSCGSVSCSFDVVVSDNIVPNITCPAGFSVNADLNSCDATNVSLGTPLATDNCSGVNSLAMLNGNAVINTTAFSKGNNTVVWTATDASGNTATCNQIITVIDNQPPTISAPANTTVAANNAGCTYSGSTGSPVLNDNCSIVTTSISPQGPYAIGNTQITWLATDASGNTAVATQTITVLPIATSSVITNVKCKGSNTGEIDLSVSQSDGTLSYLWNTGSTNQDVSNLYAGNYTVTVTNSNGCTKTTTFSISQPSSILTVSVSKTNVRCGGKLTGSLTAVASGGLAPFNYLWEDNSTSDTRSNLAAGTYTITVTDASGCVKTSSTVITQNPALNVLIVPVLNPNSATANAGGGVPPYSYVWNTVPQQTNQTATGLALNTSYKVKVTDSKGCTITAITSLSLKAATDLTSKSFDCSVYPNPGKDFINLVTSCSDCKYVDVKIFNAVGQKVLDEKRSTHELQFDLSQYMRGIYLLDITAGDNRKTLKLILE